MDDEDMPRLVWAEFQNGWMGILPCGIAIFISKIKEGILMGSYEVRFGTVKYKDACWTLEGAKSQGRKFASGILRHCADVCDQGDEFS